MDDQSALQRSMPTRYRGPDMIQPWQLGARWQHHVRDRLRTDLSTARQKADKLADTFPTNDRPDIRLLAAETLKYMCKDIMFMH